MSTNYGNNSPKPSVLKSILIGLSAIFFIFIWPVISIILSMYPPPPGKKRSSKSTIGNIMLAIWVIAVCAFFAFASQFMS